MNKNTKNSLLSYALNHKEVIEALLSESKTPSPQLHNFEGRYLVYVDIINLIKNMED